MTGEEIMKLICIALTGVATAIPLVLKLVEYVKAAVSERNWQKMLALVLKLMSSAETLLATGAERREWVLRLAENLAEETGYAIDREELGELVDKLCQMSKMVNPPAAGNKN